MPAFDDNYLMVSSSGVIVTSDSLQHKEHEERHKEHEDIRADWKSPNKKMTSKHQFKILKRVLKLPQYPTFSENPSIEVSAYVYVTFVLKKEALTLAAIPKKYTHIYALPNELRLHLRFAVNTTQ